MKFIVPLLIFALIFPAHLFADTPENSGTDSAPSPKITSVQKGEAAPYSGVLLNTTAAAQIFTDKKFFSEELCALQIQFEVQKEVARMQLLLDSSIASVNSLEQKYNAIIDIKDKEIEKLTKAALKNSNDYSLWWATGGTIVGIALTIGLFFVVSETTQ